MSESKSLKKLYEEKLDKDKNQTQHMSNDEYIDYHNWFDESFEEVDEIVPEVQMEKKLLKRRMS